MPKTTKFRKLAAGGVDSGDRSLNRFGMVPIVQKSPGVSAANTDTRIAVVPQDGGDILEIMLVCGDSVQVSGEASAVTVTFGTSANLTKFGEIVISAAGIYRLPVRNQGAVTGNVFVSSYAVSAGEANIVARVSASSVGGGEAVNSVDFIAYTTFLQDRTDY